MTLKDFCKEFVQRNSIIHICYEDDKIGYQFKQIMDWQTDEKYSNVGGIEVEQLQSYILTQLEPKVDLDCIQIALKEWPEDMEIYDISEVRAKEMGGQCCCDSI